MLQRIIPDTKPRLDFLALGFWVSSILAAILTIPPIGVFVYFHTVLDNILVGALLAFGIHFVILSVSDKIANFLIRTIDGEKRKKDIHGFMASDFFTFETDEENVVVLSINENGKERKDVHSYMLEHQVFHTALNKYLKNTPKLTY
jgi:hypothetical protein